MMTLVLKVQSQTWSFQVGILKFGSVVGGIHPNSDFVKLSKHIQ